MSLVNQNVPETPKTIEAIAIALGCPTELDGKTLLLGTRHMFVIEHEEIKLVVTKKLSPCSLGLRVQESAGAEGGGGHQQPYPSVNCVKCENDVGDKVCPCVQ